jgi:tetratricopeptide (TPR) repeat protein
MHKHIKRLVFLVLIYPATALASSVTVISYAEQLLAGNQPVKAYQWLSQHQQQLEGSAKGLYMYGVLALRLGYKQQAYTTLQQVVDLAPHNLGAQLDLAMAAIQVGRLVQADQLLTGVAQQKNIPQGVELLVASYRRKLSHILQRVPPPTTTLKLGTGYNNNVNLGLLTKQVTLDTIGGQINLNVDAANLAVAEQYKHLALTHRRKWSGLSISALGDIVHYPLSQQYNTSVVEVTAAKRVAFSTQFVELGTTIQRLNREGEVSENWRLNASTLLSSSTKLELQWDKQHDFNMQLTANANWLPPQGQWFIGLNKDTMHASYMGLIVPWTVGHDTQLQLTMDYTSSQGLTAYSPNIFGGKRKTTHTMAVKSNFSLPMGKDQRVFVNLVWQNQSSNIALFRTRKASVEIGITKQLQ